MDATREMLTEKGWVSIGFIGVMEYLSKENEFGEILYIPIHNGRSVGIVQSTNADLIKLLSAFANNEQQELEQVKEAYEDRVGDIESYVKVLREIDMHIRSTSEPIPYIVETLKASLPEYQEHGR